MSIHYAELPASLRTAAQDYVERGIRPPRLLLAALDNNLFDTMNALPGDMSRAELCALVNWARIEAPCLSRGNVAITNAWMQDGGLQGRAAARAAGLATHKAKTAVAWVQPPTEATPDQRPNVYSFANLANVLRTRGVLR